MKYQRCDFAARHKRLGGNPASRQLVGPSIQQMSTFALRKNRIFRRAKGDKLTLDTTARRFTAADPDQLRTCSIVVAELVYGACRSQRPAQNLAAIASLTAPIESLPFDDEAAMAYGRIRTALESSGKRIGAHDMLIAAIAASSGSTLVTADTGEYSRIAGLQLIDWSMS